MDGNRLKLVMLIGVIFAALCGIFILKRSFMLLRTSARLMLTLLALACLVAILWWSTQQPTSGESRPFYQSQQTIPVQR